MIKRWSSRRKKLFAGAGLATVLAVSGLGLVGPLPASAADASATAAESADANGRDRGGVDDDLDSAHRDASYVRFRVCPTANGSSATPTPLAQDAVDVVTGSTTTSATSPTTTTASSTTTASPTDNPATSARPDPNDDVIRDDPAFILLPLKTDRAKDYSRSERRQDLCYDLDKQQLVTVNATATATTTDTGTTTATTTTSASGTGG